MSREYYESNHMTANGRPVIVERFSPSSALYVLKYNDNKQGNMPNKYAGKFTSLREAEFARDSFVKETWDIAEEMTPKRKRV